MRGSALALLPAVVVAQQVCKDDTDQFNADHEIEVPWGVSPGTCAEFKSQYLADPVRDTAELCYEEVVLDFGADVGSMHMAAAELQAAMATHLGCCNENDEGAFPCADHLIMPDTDGQCSDLPDGTATFNVDGFCAPCYGHVVEEEDGRMECRGCWALDSEGCMSEAECVTWGEWDDGKCRACNQFNVWGCSEASCGQLDALWIAEWGQCAACDVENGGYEGCDEATCASLDDGHWIEYDYMEGGVCRQCSYDRPDGCLYEACIMMEGASWIDDRCQVCHPEDNQFGACDEAACTEHQGAGYQINWHWAAEQCLPCSEEEAWGCLEENCAPFGTFMEGHCHTCRPEHYNFGGCSEEDCKLEEGGDWRCEERDGMEYCKCEACTEDSPWGCSEDGCTFIGGSWNGHMCATCKPEHNNFYGCDETQCQAMQEMYQTNYMCYEGRGCMCVKCDLDGEHGGHWSYCTEEQCVASDDRPDVSWETWDHYEWSNETQSTEPVEIGHCTRCFHHDLGGCRDSGSCYDAGGQWCDTWCGHDCPAKCGQLSMYDKDRLHEAGFAVRMCDHHH